MQANLRMPLLFLFVALSSHGNILFSQTEEPANLLATQTRGDIRISLIELSERNIYRPVLDRNKTATSKSELVSGVFVEAVVSYLGDDTNATAVTLSSPVKFLVDGKEVTQTGTDKSYSRISRLDRNHPILGFAHVNSDDVSKSHLRSVFMAGQKLPTDRFTLKFTVGFNDSRETFDFRINR